MAAIHLFNEIIEKGLYDNFIDLSTFLFYEKRFSLFNSAMVILQRPNASYIETKHNWEKNYNRFLKPEAVPIVILKPFAPVDFVYDLEDTYGDELPIHMQEAFVFPELQPLKDSDLYFYKNVVRNLGIYYGEKLLGASGGGYAELLDNSIGIQPTLKSKTINTRYAIIVNSRLKDAEKAATILHEIGHILCGHLGQDKDNKFTKIPKRDNLSHNIEEYEAEKVCEILSGILNIESNSKEYLKNFTSEGSSFDIIIKAVDKVLSTI